MKNKVRVKIDRERCIGDNQPCFIVAEISANHGQNFNRAISLVKEAKIRGADAVKFQTYTADTLTINSRKKYFAIKHPKWGGQTLYELYEKAYTPWKWFKKLKRIAEDMGLIFFSTAFDRTAIDFLEELGVPMHKISSFELVDLPLIEYAAKTNKPLILSTGMSTILEVKEAVRTAKMAGAKDIILLKCVSSYPANPKEMDLNTIAHMRKLFRCPIGLSDHTMDIGASVAAVSLGAKMVEKHFALSRKFQTPDSFFSLEPREFENLAKNIRIAEQALGHIRSGLTDEEKKNRIFRRSLFAVKDIKKGEVFSKENIKSIRPGHGLPPKYLNSILNKKARRNISKGVPLTLGLLKPK
ncbi:MAG: pseudaminic acid synthase [Candidatus Omnitrophota bacterium]|nr:MAG: pseudaminic acid synthase [Candidatus Omnitrophota bacterium]